MTYPTHNTLSFPVLYNHPLFVYPSFLLPHFVPLFLLVSFVFFPYQTSIVCKATVFPFSPKVTYNNDYITFLHFVYDHSLSNVGSMLKLRNTSVNFIQNNTFYNRVADPLLYIVRHSFTPEHLPHSIFVWLSYLDFSISQLRTLLNIAARY